MRKTKQGEFEERFARQAEELDRTRNRLAETKNDLDEWKVRYDRLLDAFLSTKWRDG